MKLRFALLCVTVLMASMVLVFPQSEGTISGVVKDPTGAVIPGAEVVLTNVATGVKRTVVSDDAGFYNATAIDVGNYTVSVTMPGFKTATSDAVKVDIRANRVVNITLQVGDVSEQVTVEGASMAQVELRSGEVANLIAGEQVTELPLNGRSFVQLALLVPGASPLETANVRYTGLFAGVDISFSGSSQNANMWLVDGTNNVDIGSGRTILTYPSVDSIQEFKIQRNSYSADMGASSGAQINVVTKSGTNEFHGSLYEFHRNAALNATDFVLNEGGNKKQALVYNNFGYTVGGPIVKDKAFFFWSQEWRREGRGDSRVATVPTALERVGDFSGSWNSRNYPDPIDYVTGELFPGNKIPSDRLSPFGLNFMKLYPLPTRETANGLDNWIDAPKTPINTRQEQIRADWNINQNHSLMGRITLDSWLNGAPSYTKGGLWGDDPFPAVDSDWDQPGHSLTTQWTSTFGSGTVNQVGFSWSGNEIWIKRGSGDDINKGVIDTIPEVFPGPTADFSGPGETWHVSQDRAHATFWGDMYGQNMWHQPPWQNEQDLFVWRDDFSKVMGDHSFKAGFLYSRNAKDEDVDGNGSAYSPAFWTNGGQAIAGNQGGSWGPADAPGRNGIVTGNGVADMLLKGVHWGGGTEHDVNVRSRTRWRDHETYFSDTWRMTPRVTLTYGLRWAYLPNPYDAQDQIGTFVMSLYDPAKGTTSDNGVITPGKLKGLDVDSRSLVQNHWMDFAPRLGFAWDPTGKGKWSIRAGGGLFFNREAVSEVIGMTNNPPMRTTIGFNTRPFDSFPVDTYSGGTGVSGFGKVINGDTPGSYQWNLTVERELWKDTKVELGYVANRGHHMQGRYNANYVPADKRLQFAKAEYDTGEGSGDTDGDNLRTLFALKGDDDLYVASRGFDSWYHSFQGYLVKRFSSNVSYQLSYTYGKILTTGRGLGYYQDSTLSDPTNIGYDRGLARFDRPHIFSGNLIYKTPTLAGQNALVRAVLGEWETSTIVTMNSGVPQQILCCDGIAGTDNNRPDLISNPEGPETRQKWFNTAAFAPPSEGGRLGRSAVSQYRGPGINNWDLSFMKNFSGLPWWNNEGAQLQLRAELYNAFNHTQFQSVDNDMGFADPVIDPVTGKLTSYHLNNQGFGRITRFREPREIQVALKILW
ncbi:MAG: TonB-dependent receptor [Acidobacteria bacterium]|nr:MAG: TonB-dependent receptor [Acidobacteriota bacterium]